MLKPTKKRRKKPCGRGVSVARLKDNIIHKLKGVDSCARDRGRQIDLDLVDYLLSNGEGCVCAKCWPKFETFLQEVYR